MATKLKKCSDGDISVMLDMPSDTDSELDILERKNSRTIDRKEFVESEDENQTPQRCVRERRPPLRLSYYHCEALPSLSSPRRSMRNSPRLQSKKNLNYNEDNPFLLFKDPDLQDGKAQDKTVQNERKDYNSSPVIKHLPESKTVYSMRTRSERSSTLSVSSNDNDSGTESKVLRNEQLRKSSRSVNDKSNAVNSLDTKTKTPKKPSLKLLSINVTPAKITKHKRSASGNMEEDIALDTENENHGKPEVSADTHKRMKNVTPKQNVLTPQKRTNIQKSVKHQADESQFSTPKPRTLKCSTLTPSVRKRSTALLKPATPMQEARSRLHVSAVPKSLPCREEEFNNIFTFLKGKLDDKSGGCIYISGVPGTGKTATVNEVIRCLQKLIAKGELNDFDYVTINGMKLTEPRQSYVQILKQLTGQTATWEQAYQSLEKRFNSGKSKMMLLLVDELDLLCTKRQDVVYNLLDWPTKSAAHLVVITIANTMDLPERVLMGRVTSRLGLTRLTFQPYNHKQLQEIIVTRLKNFDAFRSEAIQLVARKVSAVSGDARRALDICRRAMEIAELREAETISLQDVTEAVSEMIASAKIQAIKHCSKIEQIFLQAVSAEVTRTAIEEVYFKDAYNQLESLCSFDGVRVPTTTEVLAACGRLGASRILICEHSRNDIYQKILLNVSTDDIHYALQELDFKVK